LIKPWMCESIPLATARCLISWLRHIGSMMGWQLIQGSWPYVDSAAGMRVVLLARQLTGESWCHDPFSSLRGKEALEPFRSVSVYRKCVCTCYWLELSLSWFRVATPCRIILHNSFADTDLRRTKNSSLFFGFCLNPTQKTNFITARKNNWSRLGELILPNPPRNDQIYVPLWCSIHKYNQVAGSVILKWTVFFNYKYTDDLKLVLIVVTLNV
jgi:hypothetical protein